MSEARTRKLVRKAKLPKVRPQVFRTSLPAVIAQMMQYQHTLELCLSREEEDYLTGVRFGSVKLGRAVPL